MGIPEVSEQFGDFEVQTYGGSPGEINMSLCSINVRVSDQHKCPQLGS